MQSGRSRQEAGLTRQTETIVSIDGRIRRGAAATISVHDWGFRYGWGAFETIRIYEGRPVFLWQHLERLARTARVLLLTETDESGWWRKEIRHVVNRTQTGRAALNLYWTRGEAPSFAGHRIVCVRPLPAQKQGSCRGWIAPWPVEPRAPGIGAKTLAYLPYTFSAVCAQAAGFDDALLLNTRQRVADVAGASLFIIDKGRLLTPPVDEGALPGITRGVVLTEAKQLGIPAKVMPVPRKRLLSADAVFLTSALRGIRVVRQIDGRRVSASPAARQIIDRLRRGYALAVRDDLAGFSWQTGKR